MKDQLFNRKILFSLLAVVMCFGFTAMSYGQAVVSVDPAEVESPAAGEELMVNINITGGADVAGYQITVNFDPTALEYVSSANADYLPAGAFPVPAVVTDSSVAIAAASVTGAAAAADGTLATVTFTVVEAKASAISLTDVTLADPTAAALEVTTMDGMVTVDGAGPAAEEPAAEEEAAEEEATEEPAAEEEAAEEPAAEEEAPAEEVAPEMPASQMFEITLTNLTEGVHGESGQTLSPAIFAAHPAGVKLAEVGQPASELIVALAEGGDVSGLAAFATAAGANVMIAMNADMTRRYTMPGQSTTVTITADMANSSLSVGSMLVSTNDAFIAAIDVPLFDEDGMPVSASLDLMAYDAGSEDNTEMASDIPGPLGLDEATDPPGSNERVPTEGGVIAAHEGIQGVGDVGEAFAWEEPTAMLTITPVDAPAEPMPEEPMPEPVVEGPGFDVTLEAGLNMISIPLMPAEPYTAKSLAEMLGATVVIQLDAATQGFVGYTVADEGDGFGIDGGKGYIVNTPAGASVKFTGDAWDNQPEPEEAPAEEPVAEEEAPAEEEVAEEPAAEEEAPADDAAADEAEVEADAGEGEGEAEADAGEADAEANGDAAPAAPALATY
ncbi:MAG: spondin domain-containing protein, partial [Candidatus Poribacteria bacterium]|nr:spondin domain-containing protein [Candidatus Poribacteria bacterium]